jgi:hypothetical protein
MRLHTYKWGENNFTINNMITTFIITEEDIEKGDVLVRGPGFEILVIPRKYKTEINSDIELAKAITNSRVGGKIIYV